MLIEERAALEKYNLDYDADAKEYKLPFDPGELKGFEFVDSAFLGKDKLCLIKSSRTLLEPGKAKELVDKYELAKECQTSFSHAIIRSIETIRQNGVVSA